jgi:hypothetical protein
MKKTFEAFELSFFINQKQKIKGKISEITATVTKNFRLRNFKTQK